MFARNQLTISIKQRIHWSFLLFVFLFVVNGIITIRTLNENNRLSVHVSTVVNPSLQKLDEFHDVLVQSKMYTTNWVFLRSGEDDKSLLKKIHDKDYVILKKELQQLSQHWEGKESRENLQKLFNGFERLLSTEKRIMELLNQFSDYDDPVRKLEAEKILEDEVIPITASLTGGLDKLIEKGKEIRVTEEAGLRQSSQRLRTFIFVLAIIIICIGFVLSRYLTRIIVQPITQIRGIINDLGKGVTRKIEHNHAKDEIGEMVSAVNNLSDKLHYTADFAQQTGERNFEVPFEPLSEEDTLGKALLVMRDNLKWIDKSLNQAQHIAKLGSWEWERQTEKTFWSDSLYHILGTTPSITAASYENFLGFIHPDDVKMISGFAYRAVEHREPFSCEHRIISADGTIKTVFHESNITVDENGQLMKLYGVVQDVTERKKTEAEMENKNYELLQKNKELEQFAYVSSHDLQEPLRTISSFVSRLQQDYQGELDEKAQKFIYYIVQGTDRMKKLINDLLDYSRIGRKKEMALIDCSEILDEVLDDLDVAIQESEAQIISDSLPVIYGYKTEIKQLFQNLIINAIKFRKKGESPRILIKAERQAEGWEFRVKDNGIGIDEEHSERIFIIFQRLHSRTQYEGSGIGLSHCKKIVELHGGKIWVKSTPGEGSTFHFTILENRN